MERRFKMAYVSVNDVAKHGKKFDTAIIEALPSGSQVMLKENDLDTASLKILVHNPEWTIVKEGQRVPRIIIDIPEAEVKELKPAIAYPH